MSQSIEELKRQLAEAEAAEAKKTATAPKPAPAPMQSKKPSLAEAMRSKVVEHRIEIQEKEKQKRESDEKTSERTFLGKKIASDEKKSGKTIFNLIPLPFVVRSTGSLESMRLCKGGFSVSFDLGYRNPQTGYNVVERFNVSSVRDFETYEKEHNVKVLSEADKNLCYDVCNRLYKLTKYFPYFDNAISSNLKHLPDSFMAKYSGRFRISYFPNYLMFPAILLSTKINGAYKEVSEVINKFTVIHINKTKMIEDWGRHIEEWSAKAGNNFVAEFDEVFSGVDSNGDIKKYLSIEVDDDPSANESQTIVATRITDFKIKDYHADLFEKADGTLQITDGLLNKVTDLYDGNKFFTVAYFDRDTYQRLSNILDEVDSWLLECGVMINSGTPAETAAAIETATAAALNVKTETRDVDPESSSDGDLEEGDDIPF